MPYKEMHIESDDTILVDWGDSNFIEYPAGVTIGTPLSANVKIQSNGSNSYVKFLNDAESSIDIVNGSTLTNMTDMCRNSINLTSFNFNGYNRVQTVENAWNSCVNLRLFNMEKFDYAEIFSGAWEGTSNLYTVHKVDSKKGKYFKNTFKNSGVQCIELLDTTNQLSTTDMLFGTNISQPNLTEQQNLLSGSRFVGSTCNYQPCFVTSNGLEIITANSQIFCASSNGSAPIPV